MTKAALVAPALLAWFDTHGRHNLPWQQDRSSYRVWVSEVMLQQTQVAAVIPYFQRFTQRFPDIATLAAAPLDEVLHLWTGLGYYARARNLHRAAALVVAEHGGRLPQDIETLQQLPGVGRSTAGAILAQAHSQRHPILDGNARRVLARYFDIEGEVAAPSTSRRLWQAAEACTPLQRVADYTQAIMDLGSAICTRSRPRCEDCPLTSGCMAYASGRQRELPSPRRRRERPHRHAWALLLRRDDAVLLHQRPIGGFWGGLWCLPMFESAEDALDWLDRSLATSTPPTEAPPIHHAFTHFDLTMHLLAVSVAADVPAPWPEGSRWYDPRRPDRVGLPKPVASLLASFWR